MAGEISEVVDRESLRAYLVTQPKRVSQAVALRAALQIFPMLETAWEHPKVDSERAARLTFTSYFALQISWASLCWQTHDVRASAAYAANTAYTAAATYAAADATAATAAADAASATAATAAAAAVSAAVAADAADAVYAGSASDVWAHLRKFLRKLENTDEAGFLAVVSGSLWEEGIPPEIAKNWDALRNRLLAEDPNWAYWVEWYEARLRGEPASNEALHIWVAQIPREDWDKGARHVNRMIAAHVEGRGKPPVVDIDALPAAKRKLLISQVAFVLEASITAEMTAQSVASQVDLAITKYLQSEQLNQLPEELLVFEHLSRCFRGLEQVVAAPEGSGDNAELQNKILELEAIITDLKTRLRAAEYKDEFDKFFDSAIVSAGKFAGPAVLSGAVFFLGNYVDPGFLNGLAIELKNMRAAMKP